MSNMLSPECRLVFLTAGVANNDAAIASLARGPVDWDRVLVIAQRENAVSSLWRVLARTSQDAIPSDVVAYLRRCAMVSDFKMLHLAQRLRSTIKVVRDAGVEVLLLKGSALGVSVYPSFVERPMVDVDMLVRTRDIMRTRDALLAAGWPVSEDPVLAGLLEGHHHLPPFLDQDATGLRIELHTSLLAGDHPFNFSDEEVWATAVDAGGDFAGARVPSSLHLLMHAAVHFSWSHVMTFGAWRTFRDVAELIRANKIDWDAFVDVAKRTRSASACYWMLRLANRMSEIPVPNDVLRRLSAPTPEQVRRALERHFVSNIALGEGPPCPSVQLSRHLWRMAIRPRWSGHRSDSANATTKNWASAFGGASPDTPPRRLVRHLTSVRAWWSYIAQTIIHV